MHRFALVLLLALATPTGAQSVALTPITVVDVVNGTLHSDLTMLVEGDRIAAIGYVIPGLWDMHAHATWPTRIENFYALFLSTVEAGKLADLVLLDTNPLDDIDNTQQIRAVVADGRLYRRAVLAAPPDSLVVGEEALNTLDYLLLEKGRMEEAIAVFEINVAAYPDAPNSYDSLADGLIAAERFEEASDALALAVALAEAQQDPGLSFYQNRLSLAEERLGEHR